MTGRASALPVTVLRRLHHETGASTSGREVDCRDHQRHADQVEYRHHNGTEPVVSADVIPYYWASYTEFDLCSPHERACADFFDFIERFRLSGQSPGIFATCSLIFHGVRITGSIKTRTVVVRALQFPTEVEKLLGEAPLSSNTFFE